MEIAGLDGEIWRLQCILPCSLHLLTQLTCPPSGSRPSRAVLRSTAPQLHTNRCIGEPILPASPHPQLTSCVHAYAGDSSYLSGPTLRIIVYSMAENEVSAEIHLHCVILTAIGVQSLSPLNIFASATTVKVADVSFAVAD